MLVVGVLLRIYDGATSGRRGATSGSGVVRLLSLVLFRLWIASERKESRRKLEQEISQVKHKHTRSINQLGSLRASSRHTRAHTEVKMSMSR